MLTPTTNVVFEYNKVIFVYYSNLKVLFVERMLRERAIINSTSKSKEIFPR